MENSPTGDATVAAASQEPTVQATEAPTSAEQNQETISTQETVSESSTAETQTQEPTGEGQEQKQTQETGSEVKTDDGLAKFARSQGFDPDNLTDGERRALKIAHDNQKFARSQKVAEAKASVEGDQVSRDELAAFQAEFRQYQAQKQAEEFFSQEGRDDSLAPVMSEILEEKKAQYGPEYARTLSTDLNLLYDLARIKQGAVSNPVDADAIRREERESINQQISAASNSQHAQVNTMSTAPTKITAEWIRNEYDPRNPEHIELMEKAGLR